MANKTEKISREKIEELVELYREGLIYFIARYVKDLDEAEDLAEDVFVEIILHPERFRHCSSEKTYLYAIGRNLAVDFLRKNRRVHYADPSILYSEEHGVLNEVGSFNLGGRETNSFSISSTDSAGRAATGIESTGSYEEGSPEDALLDKERKQKLRAAILKLKPDYGEAIRLVYFEDMSYEEAAQVMKKSKKQVENLVYRGKKSLRDLLEADENIFKL